MSKDRPVVQAVLGALLTGLVALSAGAALPLQAQEQAPATATATAPQAPPTQATAQAPNAQQALVFEAAELTQAGRIVDALAKADEAIASYQARLASEKRRVYSARNLVETLMYTATAANDNASAIVVEAEYAYAWYLRGYLLIERQRMDEALEALAQATKLSPMNSQFLSEAAHIYQERREWPKALERYESAEAASEFSDQLAAPHKARALRGQGFVLARMGRIDEAENAYRAALAIDPEDNRAKDGLKATAELREGQQP